MNEGKKLHEKERERDKDLLRWETYEDFGWTKMELIWISIEFTVRVPDFIQDFMAM